MSERDPLFTEKVWLSKFTEALNSVECHAAGAKIDYYVGCEKVRELLKTVRAEGKRVYWVGNGGSAAVCSHLSQDIFNKLRIKSHVFSDHSQTTCLANDFGYENVFKIQLERYFERGDLLIAISSGGNSKNILLSVEHARAAGGRVVALSGFSPDNLLRKQTTDVSFHLPSSMYGIVEVGHEAIIHGILETLWMRER